MPFKKGKSGNANGRPKGAKGKFPNATKGLTLNTREFIKSVIDENREKFSEDLERLAAKDRVDIMVKLMGFVVPKPQSIVLQDMTPTDNETAGSGSDLNIDNAPDDIREGYYKYLDWAIANTSDGHDTMAESMADE